MTREQNLYACAAERRFLMMISRKELDVDGWGEVVDLLYKEEWGKASDVCARLGFSDDSEKISSLHLTV